MKIKKIDIKKQEKNMLKLLLKKKTNVILFRLIIFLIFVWENK